MKTSIVSASSAFKPFTFPGLFKSTDTGSIWFAASETEALRITMPANPNELDAVGDTIASVHSVSGRINAMDYEQITTPITIRFNA